MNPFAPWVTSYTKGDNGDKRVREWSDDNMFQCHENLQVNCWFVQYRVLLTRWQMHQFVSSNKVLKSSSIKSTETLFVLTLM